MFSLAVGAAAFLGTMCALTLFLFLFYGDQVSAALGLPAPPSLAAVLPTRGLTRLPTVALPTAGPGKQNGELAPTPRATATAARPRPTRTPSRTPTPRPTATATLSDSHFVLGRPVTEDAVSDEPSWYYLYGATQGGAYRPHHGVEFVNPEGTPLVAVADATVDVAGQDTWKLCGDKHNVVCGATTNFYGNVVVLKLDATYRNQPVYVLYGHMSRIDVVPGQRVAQGDVIGAVGMSGIADGPHVHLEVRVGVNDYGHTRNPLLWLAPPPKLGLLAGRVVDADGKPVDGAVVHLYDESGSRDYGSTESYGRDETLPVNSDETLQENFALSDIIPDTYMVRVTIDGQDYVQTVTIQAGRLTWVVLQP